MTLIVANVVACFQSCIPQGKLLDCIYNPIFSDDLKLRKSKTKI